MECAVVQRIITFREYRTWHIHSPNCGNLSFCFQGNLNCQSGVTDGLERPEVSRLGREATTLYWAASDSNPPQRPTIFQPIRELDLAAQSFSSDSEAVRTSRTQKP